MVLTNVTMRILLISRRLLFRKASLLYLQDSHRFSINGKISHFWMTIDDCIRKKLDVQGQYPTCKRLMQNLLDIDGLKIDTAISQAMSIKASTESSEILKRFSDLSHCLSNMGVRKAANCVKQLRGKAIIPVVKRKESETDKQSSFVCPEDDFWFIADRPHLRDSFEGKIPLLIFSDPAQLLAIKDLLEALGLEERNLSTRVTTTSTPSHIVRWLRREEAFDVRVPFIKA